MPTPVAPLPDLSDVPTVAAPRPMPVWDAPFAFPSAAASELFAIASNGNNVDLDRLNDLPWSSDPADRLSGAFMTVAVQRRFAIVGRLLERGVSPNVLRFDPRTAGRSRRPRQPPPTPHSVLGEALLAAPARTIGQLLDAGATLGYWAEPVRDPLMIVVQAPRPTWIDHDRFRIEQVERFDALRARGFEPWPGTRELGVPEAVATAVRPELLERLVALGANPFARRTGTQVTALHLAVWEPGRAPLVGPLLDLGLDPFARDDDGRTPLAILEERLTRMSGPGPTDLENLARLQRLALQATAPDRPEQRAVRPRL